MKAHSTAKPEHSRHHTSSDRSGHGHGQQATAAPDSRPEMEQQQGLLSLMAGSPRLQRKCACGAPSAAGGSCTACEAKAIVASSQVLQKKLAIGATDDPLEREADRVADQVMATHAHSPLSSAPPQIQRLTRQIGGQKDTAPASVERVIASSGKPLEPVLRRDMEQRFGHDFSSVRVHSDTFAEKSAKDVTAKAYTVGEDIVFGGGWFSPGTSEGRRLIAHELTHVVQQGRNASSRLDRLIAQPLVHIGALQRQTDDEKEQVRGGQQPVTGVRLCHRVFDLPGPLWRIMPARHCYVAAATESGSVDKTLTSTYDPKHSGTPDAEPTKADWICGDPYPVSFEAVKAKYEALCDPSAFQLGANNCCSCADRALKAVGINPRLGDFPASNLGTGLDPSQHSKGWKSEALGLFTAAPMGDTEIRSFVAGKNTEELSAIPLADKTRLIDRLLKGVVSNNDLATIERIVRSSLEPDKVRLRAIYDTRATELTDQVQRTRFHVIMSE